MSERRGERGKDKKKGQGRRKREGQRKVDDKDESNND